jgi:hypothetical protein
MTALRAIALAGGYRVPTAEEGSMALENIRGREYRELAKVRLEAQIARASRLSAEQNEEKDLTFPAEVANRANEPAIASILANETALFNLRWEAHEGRKSTLERKISVFDEEIASLKVQNNSLEEMGKIIDADLAVERGLQEKGLTLRTRISDLQKNRLDTTARIAENTASRARAESDQAGATQDLQDLVTNRREQIAQDLLDTGQLVRENREKFRTGQGLTRESQRIIGLLPGTEGSRGPLIRIRDAQRQPIGEDDPLQPGDLLQVPFIEPDTAPRP